jgi:hypothetical protein
MNHHGGVNATEGATLKHQDLARGVADFFRRCAEHGNRQSCLIRDLGDGYGGAGGHGRNDIVAAGVANLGKGVVLGANGDV